jgi:hypothetical protein
LVGKSHIPRCSKADRLPAFGCAGRSRKNISMFEAGMLLKTNESQPKCSFILQFFCRKYTVFAKTRGNFAHSRMKIVFLFVESRDYSPHLAVGPQGSSE